MLLLRRSYNRRHSDPSSRTTSSFWNRQTTLFTRPGSRQTPIWTGWEIVNPDDTLENGAGHSPGAGSPRGSGDETDPFLTRHSVHDNASDMAQTKKSGTETLVSIPATAAFGSTSSHRSGTRTGGAILSTDARTALLRMSEDNAPAYDIRIVPPSSPPRDHSSPLLPPPPLNPDGVSTDLMNRPSEKGSDRSLASHRSQSTVPVRSIASEKSIGSLATNGPAESVELLTARRVRVGELGQSGSSTQPHPGDVEAQSDLPPSSVLGLDRLANLGRLSWFRRMSLTGSSATRSPSRMDANAATDPYTRTPPRSGSRLGSHSRPGSWARVSRHEAAGLGPDGSATRRSRLEMGYLSTDRPVSTLSATSATSVSGSTVYHSAQSRPGTPMGETPVAETPPPVPLIPSGHQQELSDVTEEASRLMDISNDPPAYEETELSHDIGSDNEPSELDVLDMPIPRPASPFSAVSPRLGGSGVLLALPNPAVWRDSHASSRSSAGIQIDVLEETPPSARNGWRELATSGAPNLDNDRRMTFGVVSISAKLLSRSSLIAIWLICLASNCCSSRCT